MPCEGGGAADIQRFGVSLASYSPLSSHSFCQRCRRRDGWQAKGEVTRIESSFGKQGRREGLTQSTCSSFHDLTPFSVIPSLIPPFLLL